MMVPEIYEWISNSNVQNSSEIALVENCIRLTIRKVMTTWLKPDSKVNKKHDDKTLILKVNIYKNTSKYVII